jgi:hypothetical protein
VLANGKKHAAAGRAMAAPDAIDLFSSAPWFDGFREVDHRAQSACRAAGRAPRTWLLSIGWRRRGLLSVHELPASG